MLCVRPDGSIEGLYSDEMRLDEVGDIEVRRASNVEFDAASGEWVAETPDGQVIGRARLRSECIRKEVEFLQAALRAGHRPW